MKKKGIKRVFKSSISILLAVMMLVSLFAVGTITTNAASGIFITGDMNGWGATAMTKSSDGSYYYYATSGQNQFLIIGDDSTRTPQYNKNNIDNSLYSDSVTLYQYGSGVNCWPASTSGTFYIIYTVSGNKISATKTLPNAGTVLDDTLIDCNLYDYYYDNQVANNSTVNQGADDWNTIPYKKFNKAISDYYQNAKAAESKNVNFGNAKSNSTKYTALYFGNFGHQDGTSTPNPLEQGLYYFIFPANLYNMTGGGNSAAMGLVDDTLTDGKLTQNGLELPYFSEEWFNNNRDGSAITGLDYITFEIRNGSNIWNDNADKVQRTIQQGKVYTYTIGADGARDFTVTGSTGDSTVKIIVDATAALGWDTKPTDVYYYKNKVADGSATQGKSFSEANNKYTATFSSVSAAAGTGGGNALGAVYKDLKFPLKTEVNANGVKKYSYDSETDGNRYYDPGTKTIKKYAAGVRGNTSEDKRGIKGYFPFNATDPTDTNASPSLNYGNGTEFTIPFYLTADGKIKGEDIEFNFTGDDDVWVYVDDKLVLDLGGDHYKSAGSLNFYSGKSTVANGYLSYRGSDIGNGKTSTNNNMTVTSTIQYDFKKDIKGYNQATNTYDPSVKHTLKMYYMERGMYDSNMSLNFTLPQSSTLTVNTNVTSNAVNAGLKAAALQAADNYAFQYTLLSNSNEDGEVSDYTKYPNTATSNRNVADTKNNSADKTGITTSKQTVLEKGSATAKTDYNFKGSSSGFKTVTDTAYIWADKYLQNDNSTAPIGIISSTATGGRSKLALQYGQSAIFYNQFKVGSDFKATQDAQLYSVTAGANGASYQSPVSGIKVSDYFNTTWSVTDPTSILGSGNASGDGSATVTDNGRGAGNYTNGQFKMSNADITNTSSANINVNFANDIKTAEIEIKKSLPAGKNDPSSIFSFKIQFDGVFGSTPTGTYTSYDDIQYTLNGGSTILVANKNDVIQMKATDYVTIKGIPVDTLYKITEVNLPGTYKMSAVTATGTDASALTKDLQNSNFMGNVNTVDTAIKFDVQNSDETFTVDYKYHPRLVVNGQPTEMDNVNYKTITKTVPSLEDQTILDYAPMITNVLDAYALTPADISAKVGNKRTATFTNGPKLYTVNYSFASTSSSVSKVFNALVSKTDGVIAPKTSGGKDFMYWAILKYDDPVTKTQVWEPVSTEYIYQYRITKDITIKAIYSGDTNPLTSLPFQTGYTYGVQTSDTVYDAYAIDNAGTAENRIRANVVINPVGCPDTDKAITKVGYVRVNSYKQYEPSVSQTALKNLINSGTPINVNNNGKNMAAVKMEYNVTTHLTENPSSYPVTAAGNVTLTNKNRAQFVFDFAVNTTNEDKYYTIYTYMIRGGVLYVSPTPAFVSLHDAPKQDDPLVPPVPTNYTISATSADTNLGTVTANKAYAQEGDKVILTAIPKATAEVGGDTVYPKFVKWVINGVTYDDAADTTVEYTVGTSNVTAVATFSYSTTEPVTKYLISTSGNTVANGTAYITEVNGIPCSLASAELAEGTIVKITASPANGYEFTKWSNNSTTNPYVYTVGTSAFNLTPVFTATASNVTITAASGGNGTATVNGSSSATVASGTNVTLAATPSTNYKFKQWNDGNTQNPRTLTATATATYTATFEFRPNITVATSNSSWGTVNINGSGTSARVDANTNVTLNANSTYGYKFIQWNDGDTSNPRTVSSGTSDKTYTATFGLVISLNPGGSSLWDQAGARMVVYYRTTDGNGKYVELTKVGSNYQTVVTDADFSGTWSGGEGNGSNIVFFRKDSNGFTLNDWNTYWSRIITKMTSSEIGKTYKVTDWNSGSWS